MVGILIVFKVRIGVVSGKVLCWGGMDFPRMLSLGLVWGVIFSFGRICGVGRLP